MVWLRVKSIVYIHVYVATTKCTKSLYLIGIDVFVFPHYCQSIKDTATLVLLYIANRLKPRSGPTYVGPDHGSSLFASSITLVLIRVCVCVCVCGGGGQKMRSLFSGGLCSEVHFYKNLSFADSETRSLFRGGLYSEVVFQAGLTVLILFLAQYIFICHLYISFVAKLKTCC